MSCTDLNRSGNETFILCELAQTFADVPALETCQLLRYELYRPNLSGIKLFSWENYLTPLADKPSFIEICQLLRYELHRPNLSGNEIFFLGGLAHSSFRQTVVL